MAASLGRHDREESFSTNSPFNDHEASSPLYPPQQTRPLLGRPGASANDLPAAAEEGLPYMQDTSYRQYDAERGNAYPLGAAGRSKSMPTPGDSADFGKRMSRNGSWDLFAGVKKFERGYEQFDTRNASESHLRFADGDIPKNKLAKLYNYLLNVSIVTRWILFIIPVLALLWIPGILGLTKFPDARIYGVKLLFWSIWLTVIWAGWWGALATMMILPKFLRNTFGVVIVGTRKYIDWLEVLHRYAAFFGWSLTIWISYNPLINGRQQTDNTSSQKTIDTLGKLLFGLMLSAALLFFEKISIQWIAGKFHERSYAERIAEQKFAVRVLVSLYSHSTDTPGRSDTLRDPTDTKRKTMMNPQRIFKKALKGVRHAATTTTTVLGNVASEIAGTSVLQPNSPQAMVKTALESANKSRLLARRLFYSFTPPGSDRLHVQDIARFFANPDEADAAFAIFDKDSNGDFDVPAVGRLDNILMSLYFIIVILIFAVALEAQVATLITSAGTLVLGLSWLIGSSLAEVLTSIIFLFVKHPYDVGDRVTVNKSTYTVKEIRLLSTIFVDSNACLVQAPNTVLNGVFINNIRRSPQMSESFEFDVAYTTSFEQIERLRELMLSFLKVERRDYQPVFDVYVMDMPGQEKLTLKADIKYKSNWQQGTLKAASKQVDLRAQDLHGEAQDLRPRRRPEQHPSNSSSMSELHIPKSDWTFADQNSAIVDDSQDVFGERDQLFMTNPRATPAPRLVQRPPPLPAMPTAVMMPAPSASGLQMEEIELTPRPEAPPTQ
uniref:C6 zinc finger protein n=1 Tax=Ganoderma boninense TaxID=34458 RepID=A0A5K1JYG0_9APHY|nr:C6 zinc finger protein [Ganoderma boninense]